MKNWFDKFDRAKSVREKIREQLAEKRIDRDRRTRLQDLFNKVHKVGPVKIPIPNLFALDWMEKHFNGLDNIDLNDMFSIAAIAWICENQEKDAAMAVLTMDKEATSQAISLKMTEISAGEQPYYIAAVDEIFRTIKKNLIQHQKAILEEAKALLGSLPVSD